MLNLTGEIFETVPEGAVLLERDAQFLGPRVTALPGGPQCVLPFPDGQHERLDAAVHDARCQRDAGARIIDERRLDLVPAHAGTCVIADSSISISVSSMAAGSSATPFTAGSVR